MGLSPRARDTGAGGLWTLPIGGGRGCGFSGGGGQFIGKPTWDGKWGHQDGGGGGGEPACWFSQGPRCACLFPSPGPCSEAPAGWAGVAALTWILQWETRSQTKVAMAKRGVQDKPGRGRGWGAGLCAGSIPQASVACGADRVPASWVYHRVRSHSVMHDAREVTKPWWCTMTSDPHR